MASQTQRGIAAAVSVVAGAGAGYLTNVLTDRPAWIIGAALAVLVSVGACAQVALTVWDGRAQTRQLADGLPLALAAQRFGPIAEHVQLERFVGREWLVSALDAALRTHRSGYVFIEAGAGLGKTTFAAWLVMTRGYPGHFVRATGPHSSAAALRRSLSAQLLTRFDLADSLSGQVTPAWTETPEGFAALLEQVAERLSGNDRLVLVVDGVDQAGPEEGTTPAGLPDLLPRGVHIVMTHRIGAGIRRPPESAVLRITAEAAPNRRDMRRYLIRAAAEPPIMLELSRRGLSREQFVATLEDRCAGVWIYLRYVLMGLRLGRTTVDQLSALPGDLSLYYAAEVVGGNGQHADPAGPRTALLVVLGAAREPLTADLLATLAEIPDPDVVRELCDGDLRPFLSVPIGSPRRYEIYHESLRDFLAGSTPVDDESLLWLGAALSRSTTEAHRRIADHYLESFGGLPAGLSSLREGAVDGYGLRHTALHLYRAGRLDELHRLLTHSWPDEEGWTNAWLDAHRRAGLLDNYLDDVELARADVQRTNDGMLRAGRTATRLGDEVRYALVAATIRSSAEVLPQGLLSQLVDAGVWTAGQALRRIRQMRGSEAKAAALAEVAPRLTGAEIAEALLLCAGVAQQDDRADAIASFAGRLDDEQFEQAVGIAETISRLEPRASALGRLIAGATGTQRRDAYLRVSRSRDPAFRLAVVVAVVEASDLPRAAGIPLRLEWQAVRAATGRYGPVDLDALAALIRLGRMAPVGQWVRAFRNAPDEIRIAAIKTLAADLSQDLVVREATETFELLRRRPQPDPYAMALLAVHVAPDLRSTALTATLKAVLARPGIGMHRECLTLIAGQLSDEQLTWALTAAPAMDEFGQSEVLAALAPFLPDAAIDLALTASLRLAVEYGRVGAIEALLPRLAADEIDMILGIACGLPEDHERAAMLAALAPMVSGTQIDRALRAATEMGSGTPRASALTALAPFVSPGRRSAVVLAALRATESAADADMLYETLARLVGTSGAPSAAQVVLSDALRIADRRVRIEALKGVVAGAAGDLRSSATAHLADALLEEMRATGVLDTDALENVSADLNPSQAEAFLRGLAELDRDITRCRGLVSLAPALDQNQRLRALALSAFADNLDMDLQAVAGILQNTPVGDAPPAAVARLIAGLNALEDEVRAAAIVALAPHLDGDLASRVLAGTADLSQMEERLRAQVALVPRLAGTARERGIGTALSAAAEIGPNNSARVAGLAGLLPHLDAGRLDNVLGIALAVKDPYQRAEGLRALMPGLAGVRRARALQAALAAVPQIDRHDLRAWLLAELLPLADESLRPDICDAALGATGAVVDNEDYLSPLCDIAQHLTPDQVKTAYAVALPSGREAITALLKRAAALGDNLPPDFSLRMLRSVLGHRPRQECLTAIAAAASVVSRLSGAEGTVGVVEALRDVAAWWSLSTPDPLSRTTVVMEPVRVPD